jgi:hypothetical protein
LAKIYVEYFEKLIQGPVLKYLDNMKQPAAIQVLPIFYQNLPVSAIHREKKQYTSTFRNFVPNLPVSAILV